MPIFATAKLDNIIASIPDLPNTGTRRSPVLGLFLQSNGNGFGLQIDFHPFN